MGRFDNKVALVTGGTSGIGAATAKILASEGAQVIIVGRNKSKGIEMMHEISALYEDSCIYIYTDVSAQSDIDRLYEIIVNKYGKLDLLFNNAGILLTGSLEELTEEDWQKSFNVNVTAVMYVCKKFMHLLTESHGVVLNNASINGLHYYIKGARSYMYATSKSALIQFSKYLAKNYAPSVRVNVICPGITVTNLFTNRDFSRFDDCNLLGRMATAEEIGRVAAFLLSNEASFITGAVIVADGGETIK